MCPSPNGHLQATGRDEAGRKQYLYHAAWGEAVALNKFDDLHKFGKSLGGLRRRVDADLRRRTTDVRRTTALTVGLLDRTGERIGNARNNGSRGLTTLQERYASVDHTYVRLRYASRHCLYEDYGPAYQFGWECRCSFDTDDFDRVEAVLRSEWEQRRGGFKMLCHAACPAVRDAWDRVSGNDES